MFQTSYEVTPAPFEEMNASMCVLVRALNIFNPTISKSYKRNVRYKFYKGDVKTDHRSKKELF